MHMNIISPIFKGRMHMASCFSISPLDPNLWKVHLVIRGKMYTWLQRFDMKVEWILNYSKPATIVQMHKSISSESLLENLLQNLQLCYIREKYSASYKTSTPPPHPTPHWISNEIWHQWNSDRPSLPDVRIEVGLILLNFPLTIGSILSSWSRSANDMTSIPKVRNVPSKKRSIRNIWPASGNVVDHPMNINLNIQI